MAYLVSKIDPRPSTKVPGSICYHIHLIELATNHKCKTYIEAEYYNYQNWREIIENSKHSFIVNNITPKNGIVNADSQPNTVFQTDWNTMTEELSAWQNSSNTWSRLFE